MQRTNSRARMRAKDVRRSGRARPMARSIAIAALCVLGAALAPALAVAAVPAAPTPLNTSAPTLTGTPRLGQKLSCSTGAWSNNATGYSYAWLRDGTPIAGQSASTYVVQNADQGHSISCQVTASNSGGEYTIAGLSSGSYKVSFKPGNNSGLNYLSQYFDGQATFGAANTVPVTAPNATPNVNAALQLGGQITGRATAAASGAPLAGIEVCASLSGAEGKCATTNGAGEYAIIALPAGSYAVIFSAGEGAFEGSEVGNYLSQTLYGVSVASAGTTAGVDAALGQGGQISGHVTSAEKGASLPNIDVCASAAAVERCTVTSSTGDYSIAGLPEGFYEVVFSSPSAMFGESESGNYLTQVIKGVPVTVPNQESGVDAALQPGGQISGTVMGEVESGLLVKQIPLQHIMVCAFEAGGEENYGGCKFTRENGEYTISSLSNGKYDVAFIPGFEAVSGGSGTGNFLPQYYNDAKSLASAQAVTVTAPGTRSGIGAVLHPGGQISGTVIDAASHAPLTGIEACASEETSQSVGCAVTNAAGEYTIGGLAAGSKYVVRFKAPEGASYAPESVGAIAVTVPGTTHVNAEMHIGGDISGRVTSAASGAGIAGIRVCASGVSGGSGGCATTNGPGGSASATSNALAVPPRSAFKLAKKPRFNAKTGNLEFFFIVPQGGTFKWGLFFDNSDTGFAASLGVSLRAGAFPAEPQAAAGAVRLRGKRHGSKRHGGGRCTKGYVKHGSTCVPRLVPFSRGSRTVPAGTADVKVHASGKALKALKAGHTLRVSGTFTFQSSLEGYPVTHRESAVIRAPKKKGKHHKRRRRK